MLSVNFAELRRESTREVPEVGDRQRPVLGEFIQLHRLAMLGERLSFALTGTSGEKSSRRSNIIFNFEGLITTCS